MATREKHIEYSSNVVRTLNPSISPREAEFDNKIDYLLEDLQQSVSRPGSSLGHNSHSNFSTMSSNRDRDVQYFTSPNSSTKIIRERSVSPTSGRRTYKTAKYEYSNSTTGTGLQQHQQLTSGLDSGYNTTSKVDVESSINQLDSLLDELKVERDMAVEPVDHLPITNTSYDSGLLDNSRTIQTSSYTTKSSTNSLRPVPRELKFDSPTHHESPRVREVSPGYKKIVETTTTKNTHYDPYVPEKLETNVLDTITRSVNQTAKTLKPTQEIVTVDTIRDAAVDLEGLPLQGNILPPPGTKVTTTVRTYTYEIPGGEPVPTNHSVVYNTSSHLNTLRSNTTTLDRNRPERDVPPPSETHIYRNEQYVNNSTTNYHPDNNHSPSPRYPESDRPPTLSRPPPKNVTYITETYNNTTNNIVDGPEVDRPFPVPGVPESGPGGPVNKTIVYKHEVRDTTNTTNYPRNNRPTSPLNGYPPSTNIEVYNEDITNTTNNQGHPPGWIPNGNYPDAPKTTYYYKHESTNTTNRRYGPPGSANPPRNNEPQPIMMTPVNDSPYPREPGTISYKYSSNTTTTNTHRDETDNLLKPAPFPAAPVQRPGPVNVSSPKRLEDLLSNFDDTPQKKGYHEQNLLPDKPYTASPDSLVETASPDQKVPTKNVAGPPVYYPPGEVTLRRTEKGAAMQAGGGYARGGGKYAYEAESKSKSKSSGGAAMVPVCLPLCCAMPCSIM